MIFLKWVPYFDINTGETFKGMDWTGLFDPIENTTGYNSPNIAMSAIKATRMIFSSYLKEINATSSSTIVAGVEYTVGGTGSFVFDTKTFLAGSTFICMSSGTPTLGTCTLTTTGRFCPVIDFVPTQIYTDDFTPSLLGLSDTVFPDSSYSVDYRVYAPQYPVGSVTVSGETEFIVVGSVGSIVSVASVNYRVGEVFTKNANFSFTATGTGEIVELYTTLKDSDGNYDNRDFLLDYYAQQAIITLEKNIANSQCPCQKGAEDKLRTMKNNLDAIKIQFANGLNLDISGTQILLDEIVSLANNQCNCH